MGDGLPASGRSYLQIERSRETPNTNGRTLAAPANPRRSQLVDSDCSLKKVGSNTSPVLRRVARVKWIGIGGHGSRCEDITSTISVKEERRRVPQVPVFGTWVLGSNFLFLGIFVLPSPRFRDLAKARTCTQQIGHSAKRKDVLVGAVGIELLNKLTKSHVSTVLPTAIRTNWS